MIISHKFFFFVKKKFIKKNFIKIFIRSNKKFLKKISLNKFIYEKNFLFFFFARSEIASRYASLMLNDEQGRWLKNISRKIFLPLERSGVWKIFFQTSNRTINEVWVWKKILSCERLVNKCVRIYLQINFAGIRWPKGKRTL